MSYVMTFELAGELNRAFQRNGFTPDHVELLCGDEVLSQVRQLILGPVVGQAVLDKPIREVFSYDLCCGQLGFTRPQTNRVLNRLDCGQIQTVRDLVECTEAKLLGIRNLGKKGLSCIKIVLNHYGLVLQTKD